MGLKIVACQAKWDGPRL